MPDLIKISLIAFMFSALSQRERSILSWYGKAIDRLPWYISRPIGGCYMCITGQACLWYYVIAVRPFYVIDLAFFVSGGILLSMCYNKLYCWLCK
jgi:hypothetical protein